ncbi:dTDP-4-dehydrorhamnose reductase [Albibacterium indicum]|uniref:dTDP-4-dehydrorhamnose reductase n=1 Tax=Albibacterium indicum TaxID=2292082 RepID=UPI000E4D4D5A|nr:dTDP-4-dehydrorhamnose reductase [Pedobacter indicus]
MKKVIVLGGSGQLGQCIQAADTSGLDIIFCSSQKVNILEEDHLHALFGKERPDVIINCAAYTAVDLAEDDPLKAAAINAQAPELIAKLCLEYNVVLIHISTDFVFDGESPVPRVETDRTDPIGAYGKTKLAGEEAIMHSMEKYIILRTSWLYSEFGNNFLKTMLRVAKGRKELSVVYDQVGSPTYAMDLAEVIVKIALIDEPRYGIYHYSNEGVASWYDFAHAIFQAAKVDVNLKPLLSSEYPTKAERPKYSVLDKSKIKNAYSLTIPHWRDSLGKCLKRL